MSLQKIMKFLFNKEGNTQKIMCSRCLKSLKRSRNVLKNSRLLMQKTLLSVVVYASIYQRRTSIASQTILKCLHESFDAKILRPY